MRIVQPEGTRGSLKWIQRLVEKHPAVVDEPLRMAAALPQSCHLCWLSPLRNEDWAEYRDEQFLRKIGKVHLSKAMRQFWPRRGPQWDALAKDATGRVFLFEAKAHGSEMASSCQAGAVSRHIINRSIEEAKKQFLARSGSDWLNGYYQYANRLAHLSFLRQHNIDAWLVFLYFTGDEDMKGPVSESEWIPHIDKAHAHLGLAQHPPAVVTLFHSVKDL